MGNLISNETERFFAAFSGFFVQSVFSGAHVGYVEAMDDYVARYIAAKRMDQVRRDVREHQLWEETRTELNALDEKAVQLAKEIQKTQIEINSAMDSNVRQLLAIRLKTQQAEFDNIFEMVEAKSVSNTQYVTAKHQAELLDHLAKQPSVSVNPIKALSTQRNTRRMFTRNKQSVHVINRLNQETTGIVSNDLLMREEDPPQELLPVSGTSHHNRVLLLPE
ncbi:protein ORF93 [Cyprinid herpesvirus 1]|uniref:Protein ORF93 n=1 Tax=Cyprinid herpesvirus 1 TaxID=317858 RepID=K7PCL0_9VIRU|nr:protein ORF93 [Cyprinid herpesvirus 1]AFJ20390.1 protein ORF93 [Cyprinid herpesvirus 1]